MEILSSLGDELRFPGPDASHPGLLVEPGDGLSELLMRTVKDPNEQMKHHMFGGRPEVVLVFKKGKIQPATDLLLISGKDFKPTITISVSIWKTVWPSAEVGERF